MGEDPPSKKNDADPPSVPPATPAPASQRPVEIDGPKRPDPTRYNDWEKGGRCIDF
jgi:hypothetical protein